MLFPKLAVRALFSFLSPGPIPDEVASAVAATTTAIGGIYTLGGMAIADLFGHSSKKDRRIVGAQLERMVKKLNEHSGLLKEINSTTHQNNGILKEINSTTLQNNELLKGLQMMLYKTAEENRQTLSHIQDTLKWFEDSMHRNFDELQAFIVEKDFINAVLIPIRLQSDYMHKAMELKTKDSYDQFLLSYKSNPPRQILAGTTEYLITVSKEKLHALNSFRGYFAGYTTVPKEKFWPNLIDRALLENKDGSDINNIADRLYEVLNGIHTTDVFSIHVFKCHDPENCWVMPMDLPLIVTYQEKSYPKGAQHFFSALNDAKIDIVVLRSEQYNDFDSQKRDLARASYRSFARSWRREYTGPFPTLGLGKSLLRAKALKETLEDLFQANIIYAFMTFNATVAVRVTNNAHPILTEDDTSIIPAYFGLTWI